MSKKKNGPDLTVIEGSGAANTPPPQGGYRKPSAQKIGQFEVPYGYEVWADGVYRVEQPTPEDTTTPSIMATPSSMRRCDLRKIISQPIWVRRIGTTLDTGEQLVELSYRDAVSAEFKVVWVDRHQVSSKMSFVKLSKNGLPINDVNVEDAIKFIDKALNTNGQTVQHCKLLSKTGMHKLPEGVGWLIGERWIGPPSTELAPDPRAKHAVTKGYVVSGDEQSWLAMWKRVASVGPVARWLLFATFAAPLLRFLKQRTFVIHHYGRSGHGKSAIAKLAISAWGDPNAVMQTFNRTAKSFTEVFRYVSDVPMLFDELQAAEKGTVAQIIYWLCLERERGRANQMGGLVEEQQEGWKSVVHMTGEETIIGKDGKVDLGGESNRVIQIGLPVLDNETASSVHQWLEQRNFGWGALRFLSSLSSALSTAEGPGILESRFKEVRDEIALRTGSAVNAQLANLATVATAEYYAQRWVFGVDPEYAFRGAIDDAIHVATHLAGEAVEESLVARALQLFQDHFRSRRRDWIDVSIPEQEASLREDRYNSLTGILHPTEVWLIGTEANALLARHGLPSRRVWADLKASGILDVSRAQQGSFGTLRCYGRFHTKVYVLLRQVTEVPAAFSRNGQATRNPFSSQIE